VILGSDSRLYGAAMTDGSTGAGRVYAMTLDGDPTILHEFAFTDGALPWGDLLEVGPGEFMGLTHAFGQQDYGTLFTVRADGSFSTLHHFAWLDGANPFGGLMRTASGDVYGATHRGGPLGGGVIFRLVDR
jgi:uncharacterized repeat protein (TIGR03803 family)